MKILAFESSCDETAVAVVEDGRRVLSDAIASQADLHALYGGVVPELASRKHVEVIAALTEKALADAGCTRQDIDAVAVTYAPGLIGAVLVGLSFAKSVAYGLGVPLIPVHHVRGHIAANYLAFPELEPPFLALAISGGNTMIVDVRDYTDLEILGATRDDAAGECFDKAARVLGLPYPGGAPMDKLAQQSRGGVYTLPHSHVEGAPLDMSFSGLKTAVVNLAHHAEQVGEPLDAPALARDFAQAVSDTLVPRVMEAAKQSGRTAIVAAGGVAAHSLVRVDREERDLGGGRLRKREAVHAAFLDIYEVGKGKGGFLLDVLYELCHGHPISEGGISLAKHFTPCQPSLERRTSARDCGSVGNRVPCLRRNRGASVNEPSSCAGIGERQYRWPPILVKRSPSRPALHGY